MSNKRSTLPPYGLDPTMERALIIRACASRDVFDRIGRHVDVELLSKDESVTHSDRGPAHWLAMQACQTIARELGRGPGSIVAVMQRVHALHREGQITFDAMAEVIEYLSFDDIKLPDDDVIVNEVAAVVRAAQQLAAVMELTEATIKGADVQAAAAKVAAVQDIGKPSPAAKSRRRVVSAVELAATAGEQWLVPGLVPRTGVTLLAGEPMVGKSCVTLAIAAAVAAGVPFAGRDVERGNILYVTADRSDAAAARLVVKAARGAGLDTMDMVTGIALTDAADVEWLTGEIERRGTKLVVLDCLNALAPDKDENSSKELGPVLRAALPKLAEHCAVILIQHTSPGQKRPRGTNAQIAASESVVIVTRGKDDAITLESEHHRRDATCTGSVRLRHVEDDDTLKFVAIEPEVKAAAPATDDAAAVFALIHEHGPIGYRDLEKLGLSKRRVTRGLGELKDSGRVRQDPDKRYVAIVPDLEQREGELVPVQQDHDPAAARPVPRPRPLKGAVGDGDRGRSRAGKGHREEKNVPEAPGTARGTPGTGDGYRDAASVEVSLIDVGELDGEVVARAVDEAELRELQAGRTTAPGVA